MRRPLLILLFLFPVLPPMSFAQHSLTYLGPLEAVIDESEYSPTAGDCVLGNRQSAVQYADTGLGSPASYVISYPRGHSAGFAPWDSDCPCSSGYYFSNFHFVFANISESPVDIDLKLDLAAGSRRDDPLGVGLGYPWTDGAPSLYISDTILQPGYYELTVCTAGWACAYPDYWYGLTVAGNFADYPSIRFALDDFWYNYADRIWYTIAEHMLGAFTDFPGRIIMWSDIICCEFPVPNEYMSWSTIKALFRD